jgi:O-antigen/teichoic acid export membrane protein
MAVGAAASLALNFGLIPLLGIFGAATSTVLSYLLVTVLTGAASQRHYPVPWELVRVATIFVLAAGLSAAALLGPDHVAWRLACAIAYPPLLVGLRLVRLSEAGAVLRMVRRR